MGAEYKVHTQLLTEFETLGVMGENNSGITKRITSDDTHPHNKMITYSERSGRIHMMKANRK